MKPLNLISLMNYAYEEKRKLNTETYVTHCVNLLSHTYSELYKLISSEDPSFKDSDLFIVIQHIFVFIMKCDNDFLQGEYDAYCKFCNYAKFKPLKVEEVNNLYNRLDTKQVASDILKIKTHREQIDGSKYEAFILSLCYLSLLGDTSFDENEYYIIRCFFEKGYDYCPSDWETFKREWK